MLIGESSAFGLLREDIEDRNSEDMPDRDNDVSRSALNAGDCEVIGELNALLKEACVNTSSSEDIV